MKRVFYLIVSCGLVLVAFWGCSNDKETEDVFGKCDFYIDSIYNVTQTSATVKATLKVYNPSSIGINHLSVILGMSPDFYTDGIRKEEVFDKKDGTVELTIKNLTPNSRFYLQPRVNFLVSNNRVGSYISSISSPLSIKSFETKSN